MKHHLMHLTNICNFFVYLIFLKASILWQMQIKAKKVLNKNKKKPFRTRHKSKININQSLANESFLCPKYENTERKTKLCNYFYCISNKVRKEAQSVWEKKARERTVGRWRNRKLSKSLDQENQIFKISLGLTIRLPLK